MSGSTTADVALTQRCRLQLLGGFELIIDDEPVQLPHQCERLCALLAVGERPMQRSRAASKLWTDAAPDRASANLRSALWTLRKAAAPVVATIGNRLRIPEEIVVDLREVRRAAERVMRPSVEHIETTSDIPLDELGESLLPEWDEEWLNVERERTKQLGLHAIDSECRRLLDDGRLAEAIDAALVAINCDPLRESAQGLLIAAHLAEGNVAAAHRQFDRYAALLTDELGLLPTSALYELIGVIEVRTSPS